MNFANLKFRDVFSELNSGIIPAVYAPGSTVGSATTMTGRDKLVAHLDMGSGGAASARLFFYAASVSTGTGSASVGVSSLAYASATSASGGTTVLELRGEYLADRNVGPWVFPVLSVSGASVVAAVHLNGFVEKYKPASFNDTAGYTQSETLLY
jgi:hypothetical protein